MSTINLLDIEKGTVIAPAGCGKTHLIAETLSNYSGEKPILILTHTNAGVASLKEKLNKLQVSSQKYKLYTIDGWAIKLCMTFSKRTGLSEETLAVSNPSSDYTLIKKAAWKLLKDGHIDDIIVANYAHIIVDEYQDCTLDQHAIVYYAAKDLGVCTLGDPLQSIFGFGADRLAKWDKEVCTHFPIKHELKKPWRWDNAGTSEFGEWLIKIRENFISGSPINLAEAPKEVAWIQLNGSKDDFNNQLNACRVKPVNPDGKVIIIGNSMNVDSRHMFAKSVVGATTVEAVDLRDFIAFARTFNLNNANNAFAHLMTFLHSLMTNINVSRVISYSLTLKGKDDRSEFTDLDYCIFEFLNTPNYVSTLNLIVEFDKSGEFRVFRPDVLRSFTKALRLCISGTCTSLYEAANIVKEESRLVGRSLPNRAVGSTLLLKGLESDTAIILDADDLSKNNLYVAMTRGSNRLVICSRSQMLATK